MRVGYIGSGNMASALARGWGDPVLATDTGSGRAAKLAQELGGEAVASNRELAERADVVILAHKPYQLDLVASEIAGAARVVVTILARTTQAEVRAAIPGAQVFRVEPNTPVELRQGVLAFAEPDDEGVDEQLYADLQAHFGRLGTVVELPERLMSAAGACSGVGPAYWALLAEAWIDAGIRHGLQPSIATTLVTETMAGAAALLRERGGDTLALRRAVASPGGTTAKGLNALERGGVRAALAAAMDDVLGA
ncbi:pyrroline-5-carboxylate reductase family protein [Candidatus Solirubrobacter pratensis]|uniref:pyrroline-5-carboxylate reductase family protein n=1 Tax=Candidatus Solirubrobacter pratensis TaxID=1298857 RepID=UPI00040CB7FA|nr:pyrroline-5-carboxylate reductase [Candidatus Solirubrobacter pratensis]